MRKLRVVGLLLAPALLLFAAQAGAAKQQASKVEKTAEPVWTLAMDGPRVAYESGGKIYVWNTVTGSRSVIRGTYGKDKPGASGTAAEVAIAGRRVAWIRRQWFGNTEAGEKLYTASLGGSAHLVRHAYRYGRDDLSNTTGGWIAGVVGAGKVLAVSTWKSKDGIAGDARLSAITPTKLRPIASGPGTIVAESADSGRIAVLRSTVAWPNDSQMPIGAAPTVGLYSTSGKLLHEMQLGPQDPDTNTMQVALSGKRLVVLTTALREPSGPTTVTLRVYDWTTSELLNAWPVAIPKYGGEVSFAVHGRLAAVEGPSRLHLVDLTTGKDVEIASSSHTDSPPALGQRGLVYALNPHYNGPGELVFVSTAKLLAAVS
jgi:hypothetical protein